jgi:glycosyltransferase involved in cell wall biosynthesis
VTDRQGGPLVVFLDHCAAWSGGEIALLRLLEPLEGCRRLVVLGEDGPLVGALRDAGVEVRVLPLAERTNRMSREATARLPWRGVVDVLAYVLRLRRLLRAERADLVHANSLKSGIYGCLAARTARVPVVWHVRDRIAPDYLPGRLVRLVRGLLVVLPDAVLVNSQATLDTLGRTVRRVVPARVIGDPYRPPRPGRARPAPAGVPTVALVGRLAPWKGQHLFLDAVERLLGEDVPVRGRLLGEALFGEEEYAGEVARRLAQPPLHEAVAQTSFTGDVSDALTDVDVVVSASVIPEPFGQVVVEAIANGVPVVVPDQGGPAEIVEDGTSGLTYRAGDAAGLAAAVRRLLEDHALYERLSEGGLARAQTYSPDGIAAEFETIVGGVRRLGAGQRLRALVGRGAGSRSALSHAG